VGDVVCEREIGEKMAEQYEDEDELDLTGADLVKDLRKQIKALQKEKQEFVSELSSLRASERQRSVAEVLAANGVNAKVAKFIPTDVEGEEAVNSWLVENAEVFGFTLGEKAGDAAPAVDEATVNAAKRLQSLGSNSQAPTRLTDYETRMANAKTPEEIQDIFAEIAKSIL
jgi:hypothetical protein